MMELDFARSVIELVAAVLTLGAVLLPLFKKNLIVANHRLSTIVNYSCFAMGGANHG
jgi:hypothetical protein